MKKSCVCPVDVKLPETREVATKVLLLGVNNFAVKRGLWLDGRGHQSSVENPEARGVTLHKGWDETWLADRVTVEPVPELAARF